MLHISVYDGIPVPTRNCPITKISGFVRKIIILLYLLMYAASWQASYAQVGPATAVNKSEPKALSKGDKIPDALWNTPLQVINDPDGKKSIFLNDYKGKLIILDFWATWCGPCIANFPKLHAVQNDFDNKIKILSVTQENVNIINKFFNSDAGNNLLYVNSVINDTSLSKYFPHTGIPHIVWISPSGDVNNITSADEITNSNIKAILGNQNTHMVTKIDIDRNRPLFLSKNFPETLTLKAYSIFAQGRYVGLPSGSNSKRTKEGKIYGRQITNLPMMDLYYPIAHNIFARGGEQFDLKRVVLEVKNPALLNWIMTDNNKYESTNLYNYEIIIPPKKSDSLYYYMLSDLNRNSNYIAAIEKRLVSCLVLIRTSTKDKIKTTGKKGKNTFLSSPSILINRKISSMIHSLNGDPLIKLPIVDGTNYNENVDIQISGPFDLVNIKKELNKYDLDLIKMKKHLTMFVIKDK